MMQAANAPTFAPLALAEPAFMLSVAQASQREAVTA